DLMEDSGESVEDLIETFLRDAPLNLQRLTLAVDGRDLTNINVHAHTLKGSSATIGAKHFAELCRLLEYETKNPATSREFSQDLRELNAAFVVLHEQLLEWRSFLTQPSN